MLNTLRRRIILSQTLTFFLIIPLMGLALIYMLESQVLIPDISRELKEEALLVVQMTNDDPDIRSDPVKAQAFVSRVDSLTAALTMLLDRDGNILASSDPADATRIGSLLRHPGIQAVLAGQISEHTDYSPRLEGQIADIFIPVMAPDHQVVGVVRLAHRLQTVYDQFFRLRYVVLAVLGLTLILATAAGLLISIRLERPLREVTLAINRLASGQELAPLPEKGPEEIRLVLQSFNLLMKRLRDLQESRRQLLANTVHELSRPLGALNSGIQALQEGADEDAELRRELLHGMNEEIRGLKRLLGELTNLYDQILGPINLDRRATALSGWLPGILAAWREEAVHKGLKWQAIIPPELPTLKLDADRLAQILGNLLNNAIKFTDKGGSIAVTANAEQDGVKISVRDTGRGIPADEQDKIFIPFYRARHAGRFPNGMGLGLAIARELAAAHWGRLEVESALGKGSRFTLWLPI